MVRRSTPNDWKPGLKDAAVEVLPLVQNTSHSFAPGWCTYASDFGDLPEVEFFCGGINTKLHTAAGLWRQGNLLHFGFEPAPAELNDNGRALLINAIVYISRFTEDRPIARTRSVFAGPVARARSSTISYLEHDDWH